MIFLRFQSQKGYASKEFPSIKLKTRIKKTKKKREKAPKTYRSFYRVFFRFSSEGKLPYKANDFSGEAEDINPTD